MTLKFADWIFDIDYEATQDQTTRYSLDHCTCGYCKNYYETVELSYPGICDYLKQFGINIHGPSELMPFAPTLILACYRVRGKIINWGMSPITVDEVSIFTEIGDENSFLLWVGEFSLPWIQTESMNDVVSPANLPEFMERMRNIWSLIHGNTAIFS